MKETNNPEENGNGSESIILYIGLGMMAIGLIMTSVGIGDKGFGATELRLIGPSLIAIGIFFCVLRIVFCHCPLCCETHCKFCICRHHYDDDLRCGKNAQDSRWEDALRENQLQASDQVPANNDLDLDAYFRYKSNASYGLYRFLEDQNDCLLAEVPSPKDNCFPFHSDRSLATNNCTI